jgi:MFS family permease
MAVQAPADRRPSLHRAAAPLFGAYLAFGVFWGVWVVVFADFLAARDLSEGAAGLQLAALSCGSIATMTLVAPRLHRLPLAATVTAGLVVFAMGALLVGASPATLVALGFAAIGVGNGLIDVFVNVGGQAVETDLRRPVLHYLHASYNVGGVIGALGAAAALSAGLDWRAPIAVTALAVVAAAAWCATAPAMRVPRRVLDDAPRVSLTVFLRSPSLLVPAIVVMSSFLVEGSMDIWSVIYLRETLDASAVAGGLAFAAFSVAMAVGRISAARLLFGLGPRTTMRVSGLGALAAGLAAAFAPSTVVAGVAFLFLGFFIASAAPAAFGTIAETDADPTLAVAGMTTVGYAGFVIGPPVMGWLAESVGFRATMVVLVSTSLGVVLGGFVGRPPSERAEPASSPAGRP